MTKYINRQLGRTALTIHNQHMTMNSKSNTKRQKVRGYKSVNRAALFAIGSLRLQVGIRCMIARVIMIVSSLILSQQWGIRPKHATETL